MEGLKWSWYCIKMLVHRRSFWVGGMLMFLLGLLAIFYVYCVKPQSMVFSYLQGWYAVVAGIFWLYLSMMLGGFLGVEIKDEAQRAWELEQEERGL